jgi:hypothetical protein
MTETASARVEVAGLVVGHLNRRRRVGGGACKPAARTAGEADRDDTTR